MTTENLLFLAFAAAVFAIGVIYRLRQAPKCSKCGGPLDLESLKDPAGFNISKKVTLSLFVGPRKYTQELICRKCGNRQVHSYWGS